MSAKLKEHIKYLLENNSTVSSLVTVSEEVRVYSGSKAPQRAKLPFIFFRSTGSSQERHLRGLAGVTIDQYQFNCVATTGDTAEAVAEAVRDALQNYTGGHQNGSTISELDVHDITEDDWSDSVGLSTYIVKAEISHY